MKTEMVTYDKKMPIAIRYYKHNNVILQQGADCIISSHLEAIQLRDFLIQLNLDKDEK